MVYQSHRREADASSAAVTRSVASPTAAPAYECTLAHTPDLVTKVAKSTKKSARPASMGAMYV